jgi:hypothetical protein
VTARKRPIKRPERRCTWHDCFTPAAATVAFELPNVLAGSRRDYCATHTIQLCTARGTVVVAHFGPHQPALPGLREATPGAAPGGPPVPPGGGDALARGSGRPLIEQPTRG